MNCRQLEKRLDDYLDSTLDPILVTMIEQHRQNCQICTNKIQFARAIISETRQNAVLYPNETFVTDAFAKVREAYPENHTNIYSHITTAQKTGFISTLAAGFLMWAVMSIDILPDTQNTVDTNIASKVPNYSRSDTISTVSIKLNEMRLVRIAIDSPVQLDNVTLSMVLPKFIELKGHHNKQFISWDTTLNKGNNILQIPLKAIHQGQGELIAKIAHGGEIKIFKVYLNTSKPDLSHVKSILIPV